MMRVDVLAANFEILNICGQSTVLASLQAAQGAEHLTQNLTCNEIHTVAHCVIEHSQQGQLHEGCQVAHCGSSSIIKHTHVACTHMCVL